jgi:hypothetical protein
MTDWKSLAKARRLNLTDEDVDRIASALDKLEQSFRPLAAAIPPDVEPATIFRTEDAE